MTSLNFGSVDFPSMHGAAAYETATVGTTQSVNPMGGINGNPSSYQAGGKKYRNRKRLGSRKHTKKSIKKHRKSKRHRKSRKPYSMFM